MVNFGLNHTIPFDVISEIPVVSELVVLFKEFLAVNECFVVIPNDLTKGREIPILLRRMSSRSHKAKGLFIPGRFRVFNNAGDVAEILSKIPEVLPKFIVLPTCFTMFQSAISSKRLYLDWQPHQLLFAS